VSDATKIDEQLLADDPLSTAAVRYHLRTTPASTGASTDEAVRPFGLRATREVPAPVVPTAHYCPERQLATDADGVPLTETMGKQWQTKSSTNGDEGPEENWGWEEEPDPEAEANNGSENDGEPDATLWWPR